jgi:hypothetical protein
MLLYEQLKQHLMSALIKTDKGEINLVMHMSNRQALERYFRYRQIWEYIFRVCQFLR